LIGRNETAEIHFKKAIEIEPDSPGILHDYAHFLYRTDRSLEALQTLHGAMAKGMSNEPIWHLGSFISAGKPEFIDFAVDWTEEAVKHYPRHEGIRGLRGETLLKAGRFREAQPYFQNSPLSGEPAAQAAVLMCRLAEGETPESIGVEMEKKLSIEFVGWYRRLLAARSQQGVSKLNSRVDTLRKVLPTAAAMLEQALKEGDAA
jgi:Tfp pilus assembly protein PilF